MAGVAGRLPQGAAGAAASPGAKSAAKTAAKPAAKPAAKASASPEALQTAGRMSPLPQEDPAAQSAFRFNVLEQDDPFERFVKQQLALLDDELRGIQDLEPFLVQEQLAALEAQLRSKRKDWTTQESIVTAGPTPRSRQRPEGLRDSPRTLQRQGRQVPPSLPRELQGAGAPAAALIPVSSEGEALRSQALERRVHRLIEKRRAREQQLELQQAPPALESPRSPVTAVGGGTAGAMRQAHAAWAEAASQRSGGSPLPRTEAPQLSTFPAAFPTFPAAGEATLHRPEAMQYPLDSAAVLSGRTWSPGHARPPAVANDRLDPVTKREWIGGPGGAVSSAGAGAPGAPRPLADTATIPGSSSTPRYSPQARVPDQDTSPTSPPSRKNAAPLEAPASRRRRNRSGSPTPPPKAAPQLTEDVGTMDVERIRQQLKPGLGTVLQEAFKPRGRTSRRSTGALPAPNDSGDLLANAAELLLRKKQEAKEAEQSSTPPATDSLLYDVSVKLREHAAQVAQEEARPAIVQDQSFETEERKAAEDGLAAEKRKLEKEEEERIKEAIEAEKRKKEEQEGRIRAAMEAEKRQQMEDEERRRAIEAEERREREKEEEERIRAALEAEKRKEREREEEERMEAALEAERRKTREREEEERIKAAIEEDKKKEREREQQERAKAAIEAEKRKDRREEEEDRFQSSEAEKRTEDDEAKERSERAQETKRKEREKDEEDRLAMEVQLLLEPPSSLPQVLEELEARIQSALALGTKKEAALGSPAVDLEDRGAGIAESVAQEVSFNFRTEAPALPSVPAAPVAALASPREPQGRKARAVQQRSPSPGPRAPAAAPPKVPILSEEISSPRAASPRSPRSPLGPRFGLEQYEPYERFINHQLALLDEELRSVHAKEPYVQEQLQALEVQLRAVKLGWTPPEDLQRNSELRKAQEENERSEMRWRNFQATKIQCLVRKRQARKKVMAVRKKEEARVQQMSVAAMRQRMAEQHHKCVNVVTLRLQARWRGKVVRRWFLQQQEERKQLEERQRQQEEARSKQLSIEATRKMLKDRETQRLTFHAVKLQAWWRGRMTRQRYRAVQEERRRLQRQQRRLQEVSITSKRLQDVELQQRTRAAQKIQGAYRCRKAKKELRRLKMNKAKQEHDKWDALKLMFRRERESLEKLREDKARRTKEQLDKQVQRYRHRVQGDAHHGHRQALDDRRHSDRRKGADRERERDRRRSDAVESDTSSVMLAEAASMLLRTRHLEQPLRLRDAEGGDPATDSLLRDVAVRLQESAVVKMQAQFRGAISRRRVNDFKAKLVEQKEAALKERKLVEEERRAARRRDWDTKVSAMRRRLAHLEERKQGDAAVTLQSNWRGHAERQRLKTSGELVEERRRRKLEEEAEKRRRDEDKIKKSAEAAKRRKETEDEVQGRIRAAVEQTEMEVEERIKAAVEASEERIKAVVERKMPAAPYPMPPAMAPYPMPMQEGYMAPMQMAPMAPPMASAPGGGSTVNIRIGAGGVDYDGGAPQSRAPDPVLQERLQALEAQLKAIKDEKEKEELRRAQEEEENEWRAQNYQATKIQSMFRGQHGRREASAERKKVEAAAQLRAQQNSVQAMRKLLEDREQRRLAHYAVKLQARWRGRVVRRKYLADLEDRKRVERQQKRQQEVEQISQRLIEVELAQRRRAAEMLQGAFRCRKARKELKRLKLLKDKEELAKMDEELKLKLQRDREELLRQMEAEKKRLRDMNRTIWLHIPFAEPTPEPPKGVQDRMVENQQRREESRKKRQQRLAEIQAIAERNARSGSPKSPRRRRGGSPGRSMSPRRGHESPG